jgi:hypothetical protein
MRSHRRRYALLQSTPEEVELTMIGMFRSLTGIIYLIVGVVVAASHHYLRHLDGLRSIASAVLAVVLWPIVLLGANLHLH